MNLPRRNLLKFAVFLPLLEAGKPLAESADEFIQIAHCKFPEPMSFEQFTEASRAWTKVDFITEMDRDFMRKGLLMKKEFANGPQEVSWTYYFKNRTAFNTWNEAAKMNHVFFAEKVSPGFEYKFTYVDNSSIGPAFTAAQPEEDLNRCQPTAAPASLFSLSRLADKLFRRT